MANKKISTSEVRLGGEIINLFRKTKDIWDRYPDLWLMGGGARDAFLNWLGDQNLGYTRESIGLRDLDLVYFGNKDDCLEISDLFRKAGYETVDLEYETDMDNFFYTRDNPINEVILRPEEMIVGWRALEAGMEKQIKPSQFEVNKYYQDITPKLGLRLISLAIQEGWEENIDPLVFESIMAARPFQLYISLYKAFQKGIAEKFYSYIRTNHYLASTTTPEEALIKLEAKVWDFEKTPYQEEVFQGAKKLNYFNQFDLEERERGGKKIQKWREGDWEGEEELLNRLSNYLIEKGFIKEAELISTIKL